MINLLNFVVVEEIVCLEPIFRRLWKLFLTLLGFGPGGRGWIAARARGYATTAAVGSCVFYLLNIYFSNEEVSKSVALVRHNMA